MVADFGIRMHGAVTEKFMRILFCLLRATFLMQGECAERDVHGGIDSSGVVLEFSCDLLQL
jgi:hypothetical protein